MSSEVSTIGQLLVILVSSSLVSNVVLSQFLGLCPFLGVSKKVKTAAGMGVAVIFVITLAAAVANLGYCSISTVCRNVFKEIYSSVISVIRCLFATYYNKLCCTWYCTYKRAERV